MDIRNYFDKSRFWLLLQLEFYRSRRVMAITFFITFGLLLLDLFVENIIGNGYDKDSHITNYCLAIGISGFVVTSMSFQDLAHGMRRNFYLTLPASIFEKLLSMWLLTCVFWLVLFTVSYIPYTWCMEWFSETMFGRKVQFDLSPFNKELMGAIKGYFVLQAIFLIGAIQFKGYAFAKTSMVVLIFLAICGIIFYWIMADVMPFEEKCASNLGAMEATWAFKLWHAMGWLYSWGFAPICWWIAYLSLKEQEG